MLRVTSCRLNCPAPKSSSRAACRSSPLSRNTTKGVLLRRTSPDHLDPRSGAGTGCTWKTWQSSLKRGERFGKSGTIPLIMEKARAIICLQYFVSNFLGLNSMIWCSQEPSRTCMDFSSTLHLPRDVWQTVDSTMQCTVRSAGSSDYVHPTFHFSSTLHHVRPFLLLHLRECPSSLRAYPYSTLLPSFLNVAS